MPTRAVTCPGPARSLVHPRPAQVPHGSPQHQVGTQPQGPRRGTGGLDRRHEQLHHLGGQRPRSHLTVVRPTIGQPAIGMSSKPITVRSSGTRSPSSEAADSTPSAITSLPHTTAVGGCGERAARAPPSAQRRGRRRSAGRAHAAGAPLADATAPVLLSPAPGRRGADRAGDHADSRCPRPTSRSATRRRPGVVDRDRGGLGMVEHPVGQDVRDAALGQVPGEGGARNVVVRTAPS